MSKPFKMALINNMLRAIKKNRNKYKKTIKLKDEVEMAGSKSIQTRFVRHKLLLYIHPYATCFLRGAKIMKLN